MQTRRTKRQMLANDAMPKRKASTRSSETGETKGRRDFVMMRWLTRISVEMEIDQLYATL